MARAVGGAVLALGLASTAAARTERVRWLDPNALDPSAPPVAGFRIHLGTSPGRYDEVIDVGLSPRTSTRLLPLYGQRIKVERYGAVYVAVTAYDELGRESAYSNEGVRLDTDGDGIPDRDGGGGARCISGQTSDCEDNCPYASNPGQEDGGGVGVASDPDGIGDACQCGDVDGDGRVTYSDAFTILNALDEPPGPPMAKPELCDVGPPFSCSPVDARRILRAQIPGGDKIRQQCPPTQPPGS